MYMGMYYIFLYSHCTHSLVQVLIGSTEYDFSTGGNDKEETKSVLLECLQIMETIEKV